MLQPRPYQSEALEALDNHMREKDTNPCVVIPTGGGKSILMAWTIQSWKTGYPALRVCVLAHRKELVQQNSQEFMDLTVLADVGIYAAGLKKRDTEPSIIFASIDSVYNKYGDFEPFDVLIIDEAHRIPAKGRGKYRSFIDGCKRQNKRLKVVGFTATPFRMGCGMICHRDHILHEVCYSADLGQLIRDGFLCLLRSKVGDIQPEIKDVKRNSGGDYIISSLAKAVDTPKVVSEAISNVMTIIQQEERKSIVFFCVDVQHCKDVSIELRKYGIDAPMVTGKTPAKQRDQIAQRFIQGGYRAICNVNVYTEGFNAKRVDCIVLLRPTLSKGMYVQMVGRGLRLHPDKKDCLVLDFARCIETHGPIDCIEDDEVRVIKCAQCGDVFSRAVRICPNCKWEIPKQTIERLEAEEREKRLNETKHSNMNIIGSEPVELKVDAVAIHRHRKMGKPDSLRVEYRCGMTVIREWICLDHPGYAGQKAKAWWNDRFGWGSANNMTVDKAIDFFLPERLNEMTQTITVIRKKKNYEIVGYDIRKV
jgi:DNA repair protein RadD